MRSVSLLVASLFILFFIPSVLAFTVSVTPTSISQTIDQGQSTVVVLSYTLTNQDSLPVTATLNLGNFPNGLVTSSVSSIDIPANDAVSGTISLNFSATSSTTPNTYTGTIFLGSFAIPASLTVNKAQSSSGACKIYTLPIPLTKTLEAGQTASQSVDVYVSKYCNSALTISTNQPLQQKPIKFDALSGNVEPAGKFTIQINYDTRDVQRGTYQDQIVIIGVDENEAQYTLTIPISLTVSNTISPTNGSFGSLPTCSLSASSFSLNQTYKISCTNVDPNIQIQPLVEPAYIVGASPYVEEGAGTYSATIKPIALGVTTIKVNFLFKNLLAGVFSQQVTISTGGTVNSGTYLLVKFYPSLEETNDGNVIVRVLDNSTGAVLDDAKIYLDGALLTNNSIHLENNKKYELKADHVGYNSITKSIALNPLPINFTLENQYLQGSNLLFVTSPPNSSILYDGQIITLPFTLKDLGTHVITVSAVGYTTTIKNISIVEGARVIDSTNSDGAKVGELLFVKVDKNSTPLRIEFRKDSNSEMQILNQSIGDTISVEIKDAGTYNIFSGESLIKSYLANSSPFYKTWWFWTIIGIIVIIVVFTMMSKNTSSPSSNMAFNVGDLNG